MPQFRCSVCGYIHDDSGPPVTCPKCGADIDDFYDVNEEPELKNILEDDFGDDEEEPLYEAG